MIWLLLTLGCGGEEAPVYTGTIEVTEVEVSAAIGGRLIEVLPHEGDRVQLGDPVFRIDTALIEAERDLRSAAVDQSLAGEDAASAKVRAAAAQVSLLRRELERVRALEARGVGTAQQVSQLSGQLDVAVAQHSAAQQGVRQAEAGERQARAGVRATDARLAEAVVTAAVAGTVLSRNHEPGEVVGPGASVVTLGDLQHPRLRIYVPLLEIEQMELGETIEVRLDGFSTQGKVSHVASEAEFTPREILTPDERVKRVFAVDIALEPQPGLHPGLPAEAVLAP